ncbi:hypothetical protein [Elizabethkingia bruuniana]|uniref:hypothetical protein n=1 Tax=Elizabethkingia bruuniana TaxID=1756149 RepID=UPI00241C88D5|nr:hypothetical protein [Elizabethkingia bruuniana]
MKFNFRMIAILFAIIFFSSSFALPRLIQKSSSSKTIFFSKEKILSNYADYNEIRVYFNPRLGKHYYGFQTTPFRDQSNTNGWVYQTWISTFSSPVRTNQKLLQSWRHPNGDMIIACDENDINGLKETGWNFVENLGYVDINADNSGIPVHRYFKPNVNDHFFTINFEILGNGKDNYRYEGVPFYIPQR